jgi:hypothetical protein
MNLQEQVSRIQSMMGVINEDKNYALKIYLQKLIDDTISELREESEDWGLGEMDGIDELNSIEKIEIDRVVDFTRLEIYVNIFVNSPRRDFDNVMSTINYEIQRYIPNSFVQVDDIIDNRTFGPGIDW